MAWSNNIITTIFGRRLGLQPMSSSVSGSGTAGRVAEFLVGADGLRVAVTTAETTAVNLAAHGVSWLGAVSSGVFTLDPPIPGVHKYIMGSSNFYVKTANSETIASSFGSTMTVIGATLGSSATPAIHLMGVTTGQWIAIGTGSTLSGIKLSTTT